MDEGGDDDLGELVPFKEKERGTTRERRTQEIVKETVREGDPGTQVRNRQGEDPRTLEKAVKVGTSVLAQHTASK